MSTAIHPVSDQLKPSFVNPGTPTLSLKRQSARMSKIQMTASAGLGLTQDVPYMAMATVGVKGLKLFVPPLSHPTPPLEPPQLQKCRTANAFFD